MKSRMKEPSTWAGIAAFLSAAAQMAPNPVAHAALLGLSAVAGALAVQFREG